eukprot:CAMPEP_0178905078 /NCGR_PEP_ID=MMETSP0786-20121207/6060_1 /TAXON_ID=186022 /ORGANISM="Thalassionema frauenfeldii, Strain CCMP 1798" /LENGTH=562 /DNA_ID=CAMNT_0020576615 /DNA_START=137 /DNA_END=1822 /DNA_ORIENTATION=-
MAPSTIAEDANMGIYTAKDLQLDEVVQYPEIAIPLLFRDWATHSNVSEDGVLWDRYIWDHGVASIEPKYTPLKREDKAAVFVPGVGCTINSRLELHNIISTTGSKYDTCGLHRSTDAGAGAFSPYHSSQTVASRFIPAGAELMASYGDTWIPEIPGVMVTMDETLDKADDFLIDEYYSWIQERNLSTNMLEGLWNMTREFGNGGSILTNNFVLGVLPREASWQQVQDHLESTQTEREELEKSDVLDSFRSQQHQVSPTRKFLDDTGTRSLEWLQQHGKCQDHLRPDRSTIAQAGRGAFATRNLPKGTVVGYSPLIHFGTDGMASFDIHENVYGSDERKARYDLILNYSFGHANSTLLLTPYGAMVNYINHHRERANVKVQWPAVELVAHKPEWLGKSPTDLHHVQSKIGLSLDYVALRDIEVGEEVFMDYGDEWIEAWERHVQEWSPEEEPYVHSTEWTEPYLRTLEELITNPYPSNLITLCTVSYQHYDDLDRNVWTPVVRPTTKRRFCDVLERDETNETYTVRIHAKKNPVVVHEVPRGEGGVELMDQLHSADWHLGSAF